MSKRSVFLVHGRDHEVRDDLIALLRAFDLRVVGWREAASAAGSGGTPHTDDIVRAGMDRADAIVILLTPDDIGYVRPRYLEERDGPDELAATGQARQNVIFEAGMAIGIDRRRVVLVEVGATRALSDTAGINMIRLRDHVESRKDFATRLRDAGLDVDTDREEWRTTGSFDRAPVVADFERPAAEQQLGPRHDGAPQPGSPKAGAQRAGRSGSPAGGASAPGSPEVERLTETLTVTRLGRLDTAMSTDVVGELTNESEASLSVVMLEATFYDEAGRIVGTAGGGVNGLAGKTTKSFRLMSAGVVANAASFKVQANGQF